MEFSLSMYESNILVHPFWINAHDWLCHLNFTSRENEKRFGDNLIVRSNSNTQWHKQKFHLLGIEECVGPLLNLGRPGAQNAFSAFMERFLTLQDNSFYNLQSIVFHGVIRPGNEINASVIEELDKCIINWTKEVVSSGGIPIVVGGGHNNALGLIAGVSQSLAQKIDVLNFDAHADLRLPDFRHSGNSFSYAFDKGYLDSYHLFGAHKAFNNAYIIDRLNALGSQVFWLDDGLNSDASLKQIFQSFLAQVPVNSIGIEIDMDVIANMPSSALSPEGFSLNDVRSFLVQTRSAKNVLYYNFTEAAPNSVEERILVGKALAYLVSDIISVN